MPSKCCVGGCSEWEFQDLLCRKHKDDGNAHKLAHLVKNKEKYLVQPAKYVLIANEVSRSEFHLPLSEGEEVDVLDIDANGACLCRTLSDPKQVGYYPRTQLLTKEEIYEQFIRDEDARLEAEILEQKRMQDKQAADYEKALRDRMFQKAEADRKQRAADAEYRRQEAERLQRELEAQRAQDAEAARQRDSMLKEAAAAEAKRRAEEEQRRIQEAHANKAQWDARENDAKDRAYLASLPAWKRDVVLQKRKAAAESDANTSTVFPGATPR